MAEEHHIPACVTWGQVSYVRGDRFSRDWHRRRVPEMSSSPPHTANAQSRKRTAQRPFAEAQVSLSVVEHATYPRGRQSEISGADAAAMRLSYKQSLRSTPDTERGGSLLHPAHLLSCAPGENLYYLNGSL